MESVKKLTKDERIAARSARVAAKRSALTSSSSTTAANAASSSSSTAAAASSSSSAAAAASSSSSHPVPAASRSKASISSSRHALDSTKLAAEQSISGINQKREAVEQSRRSAEQQKRSARLSKLQTELAESRQANDEIAAKWDQVAASNVPQDLYAQIASQYKLASRLLNSKDEIIRQFQSDLKGKDEEYVELLALHQDDLLQMCRQMRTHFQTYLSATQHQLAEIETAFLQERTELLNKNKEELETLFEKRRKLELSILENRVAREQKYVAELEEIRSRDAEDYSALKIDLESSIQIFEQQLEEMRAVYQLNAEKLEYNHAVLMERDHENKLTQEHHRHKLRKLKEQLNTLINKFQKQEYKFQTENKTLTNDYKRLTQQFKELQAKFSHFVVADTKQYAEIYQMNEQQTMQLVRKLLIADQIIHQQVLGGGATGGAVPAWRPPIHPADVLYREDDSVDIEAITAQQIVAYNNSTTTASNSADDMNKTGALDSTTAPTASVDPSGGKFSPEHIKAVLDLLTAESDYFIDGRIRDILESNIDPADKNEGQLYKSDGILFAIGVEDREDLDELVACFYTDPASTDKLTVHPNDVSKVIKEFVVKRQQVKSTTGTGNSGQSGGGGSGSGVASEKRARKLEKERQFWHRLGNVVSEERLEVWQSLSVWQTKYNQVLEERQVLIDETSELARQNEELKVLLQEYLSSKTNAELQIPPTRLMRVQR